MKKIIIMGILSSIFGLMGCNAQTTRFKTVDAKAFADVIADTSVVVLDVRTAEEFQAGNIRKPHPGFPPEIAYFPGRISVFAYFVRKIRLSPDESPFFSVS